MKKLKSYYHGGRSKNEVPYKKTFLEFVRALPLEKVEEELARYYSHVALGFLGYSDKEGFCPEGPEAFLAMDKNLSLTCVLDQIENEAGEVRARQKKVRKIRSQS